MDTQTATTPLASGASPNLVFQRWNTARADPVNAVENNPTDLRLPNAPSAEAGVGTQVTPRMELLLPGEPCSIDMEFINFQVPGVVHPNDHKNEMKQGKAKWEHRPAWVAITNTRGEVVLDVFVKYPFAEGVRTMIPRAEGKDFGITKERIDMANGAVPGWKAEQYCERIFRNRPVVVHGGAKDLTAFQLQDPFASASRIHDTQNQYAWEVEDIESPGLERLAGAILDRAIQQGGKHSPVEDAVATMELHLLKNPYDRDEAAQKWKAVWGNPQQQHAGGRGSYRGGGPHGSSNTHGNTFLRGNASGRGDSSTRGVVGTRGAPNARGVINARGLPSDRGRRSFGGRGDLNANANARGGY